jgi:hypothetical protein
MAQIPLIYTDEQRLTWIAFCAAQNLLIYRSNPDQVRAGNQCSDRESAGPYRAG